MAFLDEPNLNIDPQTVPTRPAGVRWGLILGLISVVLAILFNLTDMMDYTGAKSNWIPNVISWGATAAVFYLAIKQFRDEESGGFISLGKCVSLGAWIGLISGLISAVFMFVWFQFIETDLLSKIVDTAIEQAENRGQDPEQVRQGMEMMGWMFSPAMMGVFALIGGVIFGLIISLVVGLFMRKDPPRPF